MESKQHKNLMARFKIQVIVFIGLFVLSEIILRFIGMKAGTLIDDFQIEDHPIYLPRFISDSNGINHLDAHSKALMNGSKVNAQGFLGEFNYTKASIDSIRLKTGKKIVMIIGDSFVEGCCADSVTISYAGLLSHQKQYQLLNFGVAGTDPQQYALIVKRYVKELNPDLVLVNVFFGNDFLTFERKVTPGIPLTYPFYHNKWIYATPRDYLSNEFSYVLKTPEEAYQFYMRQYTLRGDNRNYFQRILSHSVIFSKIYLLIEHKYKEWKWVKNHPKLKVDVNELTHVHMRSIQQDCDAAEVPCVFVGIPAPAETEEGSALTGKYKHLFQEVPYIVPSYFKFSDYDGKDISNHFNNTGHVKYAHYLDSLVLDYFKGHQLTKDSLKLLNTK